MSGKYSTRIDLTGQQFGRLTVIKSAPHQGRRSTWECVCECGKIKIAFTERLRAGRIKSCGCRERMRHGMHKSPEYIAWLSIKSRCLNETSQSYKDYGGRGITMCNRWLNSFENFYADMGLRPSKKHSIERIDNDQGYSPDNCKWATMMQQNRNRRGVRLITFNGETLCITDWAKRIGIGKTVLALRLRMWPIEDAMTRPVSIAHRRTTL